MTSSPTDSLSSDLYLRSRAGSAAPAAPNQIKAVKRILQGHERNFQSSLESSTSVYPASERDEGTTTEIAEGEPDRHPRHQKRKREAGSIARSPSSSPAEVGDMKVIQTASESAAFREVLSKRLKTDDRDLEFPARIAIPSFHSLSLPSNALSVAGLPLAMWQRIFCFVPPVFLGRLLRVNKAFRDLLTPREKDGVAQDNNARVPRQVIPEDIWIASRRRFCPGLPKPIRGQHDLDMWRLLRGKSCQMCQADLPLMITSDCTDPWRAGPGVDGTRIIWPFAVRCCGNCLKNQTEQVASLTWCHGLI